MGQFPSKTLMKTTGMPTLKLFTSWSKCKVKIPLRKPLRWNTLLSLPASMETSGAKENWRAATLPRLLRDGSAADLKWHASHRSVGFGLLKKKNPPTCYKNRQVPSQNYCLQAKAMKPSEINLTHHPLHPGGNPRERIVSYEPSCWRSLYYRNSVMWEDISCLPLCVAGAFVSEGTVRKDKAHNPLIFLFKF